MLKIDQKHKKSISQHLSEKGRQIVITNLCNLNCGGCCQLIGHFKKEQLWNITLEELENNIKLLEKFPNQHAPITIFGGEPTLHPEWDEIVKLLKSHAPTIFWVNTNGRLGHKRYQKEDNLVWWVDLHPDNQLFVQTLYAAADAVKLPNDMAYWEKAQKDCAIWKGCQCSIYNGKAYFCENAGAIDWLFNNGENGWSLESNKNPFNRTKEEIDEQAQHCCKRCGWCVSEIIPRQLSKDPSYVSPYNQGTNNKRALPVIQPMKPQRWRKYDGAISPSMPPSIGIYRLDGDCKFSKKIEEWETTWVGVTSYRAKTKEDALREGQAAHEWTIVLEPNQVFPNQALSCLIGWMCLERTKEKPRLNVSIPVYTISENHYDPDMEEPTTLAKDVTIGFHRDSKETWDDEIYGRLRHRKLMEGSGRPSLWSDELTDIVGGVVSLV